MSEEHPQVRNISDLDTFLSEFPSEGGPEILPVDANGLDSFAAADSAAARPATPPLAPPVEPGPVLTPDVVAIEVPPAPKAEVEPRVTNKPATITEFPVHATRPPTTTVALVPNPITLVDLLERQGGLEWRQAVGVIHQICGLLKQQPSHQPILLEPRNILVTHDGQVRLLPGMSSGDPLVIQLGRLLRTMLTGNDAPPELRLLLAQATFELPIFESVEDVDRALVQLEKLDGKTDRAGEFINAIVPSHGNEARPSDQPATRSGRSILPKPHGLGRRQSQRRTSLLGAFYAHGVGLAVLALAAVGLAALFTTRPSLIWPSATPAAKSALVVTPPIATPTPTAPEPAIEATSAPHPASPRPSDPGARLRITIPAPALVPVDPPKERDRVRTATNRPTTATDPVRATEGSTAGTPTTRASAPTTGTTAAAASRDSERRAASLIAQGQTEKAGLVFDTMLLSNPLYEPDPTSLTPEALDAFRTSQRNLLPNIALKNFDRARASLASGDAERALTLGREVAAILDRRIAEPPAQMREQVDELINTALAAKSQADEIIYTAADKGVVAPRELSRQFPASGPLGVPPHRVGTLEMIIDKDGGVEFVKLHTPLNRYHERMIVSAAKAWRYRPATRNGKPVKYRLTVRINLPESGTDF